jgi:hypothetical protein
VRHHYQVSRSFDDEVVVLCYGEGVLPCGKDGTLGANAEISMDYISRLGLPPYEKRGSDKYSFTGLRESRASSGRVTRIQSSYIGKNTVGNMTLDKI